MKLSKNSNRQWVQLFLFVNIVLKTVYSQHTDIEKNKSSRPLSSHSSQTAKEGAVQDYSAELRPYAEEAKKRGLPMLFFNELIEQNSWISVKSTTGGAQYRKGIISGGTIYFPFASQPVASLRTTEFSNFYNELFHAWWDQMFLKEDKYKEERNKLLKNKELENKYRRAHPRDPHRAQEEAYSETVATLIIYARGTMRQDPSTGQLIRVPPDLSKLYYNKLKTVSPVSHSDVPGFTSEAENIYPDQEEYSWIFEKLFGQKPPAPPAK